jgi:hypothetical protein
MALSRLLSVRNPEAASVPDFTFCGGCGASFDRRAWGALPLVEWVTPEQVRAHVTSWPAKTQIEVRRCRCGRELARTAGGVEAGEPPTRLTVVEPRTTSGATKE